MWQLGFACVCVLIGELRRLMNNDPGPIGRLVINGRTHDYWSKDEFAQIEDMELRERPVERHYDAHDGHCDCGVCNCIRIRRNQALQREGWLHGDS
jgi:hypothetical protein